MSSSGESTSVVIHRPQYESEAQGIITHLREQNIDAKLIHLKDTSYPGVADRHRPFAEIRVAPFEADKAKQALDLWRQAVPEDLESAWQQPIEQAEVAKPRRRDPWLAAMLSAAVPGVGQLFVGEFVQSLFALITAVILWRTQHGVMAWGILALVTSVSAYLSARSHNERIGSSEENNADQNTK